MLYVSIVVAWSKFIIIIIIIVVVVVVVVVIIIIIITCNPWLACLVSETQSNPWALGAKEFT